MIRGGIDLAILGAMEVSCAGDLANWMIPAKWSRAWAGHGPGQRCQTRDRDDDSMFESRQIKIGGTLHASTSGVSCVDQIVTDMGVIDVVDNRFLVKS